VSADLAAKTGGLLDHGKETADLLHEWAFATEVDGALSAVFTPGEAVVGSETPSVIGSPGGDYGALAGEPLGVAAKDGDGGVVLD
jgi:hypothetical protein